MLWRHVAVQNDLNYEYGGSSYNSLKFQCTPKTKGGFLPLMAHALTLPSIGFVLKSM